MELKLMLNDDMQGGCWVDSNNNKWDITLYSKKKAKKHAKSLNNCKDCINCVDCSNCTDCINCKNSMYLYNALIALCVKILKMLRVWKINLWTN